MSTKRTTQKGEGTAADIGSTRTKKPKKKKEENNQTEAASTRLKKPKKKKEAADDKEKENKDEKDEKKGNSKDVNSARIKKKKKKDTTKRELEDTNNNNNNQDEKDKEKKEDERTNRNDAFNDEAKVAMKQFTYQIVQSGLHQLRVQFNDLKSFVPADASKKHFDANPTKCRYKDVPCWDRTRVILSWPPGVAGDFVHANRISHELLEGQQYICCQGPLDATVSDFWRCVWQEKVKQIIMLCRCEELGKAKCAQYWPATVGEKMSFHGLTIKCEKVDSSDRSFIHTKLALTYESETRMVDHRQWTTWPDKSVPKTPMASFRLLQYTRKNPSHSTVIHCSAGVGRTGTLLMIEFMYRSLIKGKIPDVVQLVKDARSQRSQAVQTEEKLVVLQNNMLEIKLEMFEQQQPPPHNSPGDLVIKSFDPNEDVKHTENQCQTQENVNQIQPPQQPSFPPPPPPAQQQPDFQQQQFQTSPQCHTPTQTQSPTSQAPEQQQPQIPQQQQFQAPYNPPPPIQPPPQQQQQQQFAQPNPFLQQQQPQAFNENCQQGGPQKYQYKPALTYTVQQPGNEKAIVYHRNPNQPFIKAIASPAGTPQPICLVQSNVPPQFQQQQQGQQPPIPPQQNQPGVPFQPQQQF